MSKVKTPESVMNECGFTYGTPKIAYQLTLQKDIKVPWEVWRFFGSSSSEVRLFGNQASFGEDFGTKEELRVAIEWFVDQLDGDVKWKK